MINRWSCCSPAAGLDPSSWNLFLGKEAGSELVDIQQISTKKKKKELSEGVKWKKQRETDLLIP